MDRLLEFCISHPELVGTFVLLLTAFFFLETRRGGKTVSAQQLTNLVNGADALVLDVRDAKEFRDGHITGSKNIVFSKLKDTLNEIETYKDKPVVIVCKMGQHAGAAGKILHAAGFTDVKRLSGGIGTWKADSMPLVKGN